MSYREAILRLIALHVLCLFRDFTDFVGEKDKKVTLVLRATQVPEALLGKMARRASQGIPVTQDKTVTSKARRAPKENEEDKGDLDRRG